MDPTEDQIIYAVQNDGMWLAYAPYQTPAICLAAVKENGKALRFVKEQTDEICYEAVKQNGRVLHRVKKQTPEICLEAVKDDSYAFFEVNDKTVAIYQAAINRCPDQQWSFKAYLMNELNKMQHNTITDICIAFRPLRLPSYVLLEIIEWTLDRNEPSQYDKINHILKVKCLTHYDKINHVIRINERQQRH